MVADKTKTKSGGFKVQQQQQTDTSFYLVSLHCSHETLVRHFTYGTRFKCTDPGGLLRVVAFLNLLKPRSTDTGRGFCPRTGQGARTKKPNSKQTDRTCCRARSLTTQRVMLRNATDRNGSLLVGQNVRKKSLHPSQTDQLPCGRRVIRK